MQSLCSLDLLHPGPGYIKLRSERILKRSVNSLKYKDFEMGPGKFSTRIMTSTKHLAREPDKMPKFVISKEEKIYASNRNQKG